MPGLAVLIPARHEMFLGRTVASVLDAMRGDTEVVVVCDGEWPLEPLVDHPRLHVLYHARSIGQRASFNEAMRLTSAEFVMKLDAHCAVDEGFDEKLLAPYRDGRLGLDTTTIPRMYNLHAFDWLCRDCGKRTYQGPTAKAKPCPDCKSERVDRDILWKPRLNRRTDFARFDRDLKFEYWMSYEKRRAARGDLADVMSSVGACWVQHRARALSLGGLDEGHGSWGQCGTEVACQAWLSGGRQVVNKTTWFAHMFRTQGLDFSWPYPQTDSAIRQARAYSQRMWRGGLWPHQVRPLAWLVRKFWPVDGWDEADIDSLEHANARVSLVEEAR